MPTTFLQAKTAVQGYLNNTSADVSQAVKDSIRFLSSAFPVEKLDTSKNTVASQAFITKPTGCISLDRLQVAGVDFPLIDAHDTALIAWYEDQTEDAAYEMGDNIYFVQTPTAVSACRIWGLFEYTVPANDADVLDVPDRLMELVFVGGVWRYWRTMVAIVANQRESLPDVNPGEVQKCFAETTKQYFDLVSEYKRNAR